MKLYSEPSTRQGWLDRLGRRLVWYLPERQVMEILTDYQEQFEAGTERGRTEQEALEAIGRPADAAAELLEEEPTARFARLRTSLTWVGVLALCLAFLWVSMVNAAYTNQLTWVGVYVFIPTAAAVAFMLLRGPARVALERAFPPEGTPSPVLVYYVPFVLMVLLEAAEQILVLLAENSRLGAFNGNIGELNTWFILGQELVFFALLVWLVFRSVTASIRYFPGVIHTVGAMGTAFFSYIYFTAMNPIALTVPSLALVFCLLPYALALGTALMFQRWIDGRRPMPRLFRTGTVSRQGWLHRLGQSLLGWFPAGQALEVLEDYQEQFELGLERGRNEEELLLALDRPEEVVRDLVKEDWKAKRYHRKALWWAAPLAVGVWLLIELAKAFEFGCGGLRWLYCVWDENWKIVTFALALSAVSGFALLHGRGRAELERRFPAEKKPGLWLWLLPLVLTVVMNGWALWILQEPAELWRVTPFNFPLYAVSIELSVLGMTALLVWTLSRCASGSIWHFPAAVHMTGYIAQVLCAGIFLHGMDIESGARAAETLRRFLLTLPPYGAGVLLAAGLGLAIRSAGKER